MKVYGMSIPNLRAVTIYVFMHPKGANYARVRYIIMESEFPAVKKTEAIVDKIRPYMLDLVVGVIFILLPGIRRYTNWQIHEYALLLLIYG